MLRQDNIQAIYPSQEDIQVFQSQENVVKEKLDTEAPQSIIYPSNLAGFPEAPSLDMVQNGLELQYNDQALSTARSLRRYYRQPLLAIPYLIACVGQGFDQGASGISGTMPAFLIKFGDANPITHRPYIPSGWLSGWNAVLSVGLALGSAAAGSCIDRFGPKKTMQGFSLIMLGAIAIQVASVNRAMLLIGKLLAGIPMGAFLVAANNYISESTTVRMRAITSSLVLFSICGGIAAGLAAGYTHLLVIDNGWGSWRLLFALQWIFPVLTLLTLPFVADSPAYYVKRGRPDSARIQLQKIFNVKEEPYIRARLALIQQTVALEQEFVAKTGVPSYFDLFAQADRKRTLICCGLWICYQFGGTSFLNQGIYFLSQLGIPISTVFGVTIGLLCLSAVVGPFVGLFMETLGRRPTFIYGMLIHVGLLFAIGGLGVPRTIGTGAGWALSLLMGLGVSTQSIAIYGPAYALLNEIPSLRLRGSTQATALFVNSVFQCIFAVATPYMFQVPGNWGAKTGFFFGGLSVLGLIWGYFYIPETRNRSSQQIDWLYERDIPARNWKETDTQGLLQSPSLSSP